METPIPKDNNCMDTPSQVNILGDQDQGNKYLEPPSPISILGVQE